MSQLLERAERILESAPGRRADRGLRRQRCRHRGPVLPGRGGPATTATSNGFGIRILNDSANGARVGTAWAGSLDDEAVVKALREARDNATFATKRTSSPSRAPTVSRAVSC